MSEPGREMSGKENLEVRTDRGLVDCSAEDAALDRPKAAEEQRADPKEPGRSTSKSEAIRRMACEMVSRGQPPRPKDIVAELGKQGIVVLSSQVSTALAPKTFTDRPKAAEGRRVYRKELGRAISKSKTIRLMAREMVSRGQPPRPKDIVMELRKQGIVVVSSQVSMALRETEFALRQLRVDWDRPPVMCPDPAQALMLVRLEDVQKANDFVIKIGSFEKAMAALVALRQFGGEQVGSEQVGNEQVAATERKTSNEPV